jgi:hypothetical protein
MNRSDLLKGTLLTLSIIGMIGLPLALFLSTASVFPDFFRNNSIAGLIFFIIVFFTGFIPGQFLGGLIWAIIGKALFNLKKEEVESLVFSGPGIKFVERWNRFCMKLLFDVDPEVEYENLDKKYITTKSYSVISIAKTTAISLFFAVIFFTAVYYLGVFFRFIKSLL